MKKLFLIFLGATLASGAFAQTAPQKVKTEVKQQDLKGDIKEKRADEKSVRKDLAKGKVKKAHAKHQEVKAGKADINKDAIALKKEGVANPKAKARKEIKEESKTK